jgi:para-aminobenzoate synthetase component I
VQSVDADSPYAVVRDGDRWIVGTRPSSVVTARGAQTFGALDEISRGGFWVGFVAYEAGRAIEHITPGIEDDLGLPDVAFVRFDEVRAYDELPPSLQAVSTPTDLGPPTTSLTPARHAELVARIHTLLSEGECYQVNLTRRLTFGAAPDPLALFTALTRLNPAPYAGLCTFGDALPGVAVVSASPELFLRVDGRVVETRPIKGTAADGATLEASAKDHAENLMIVDLARNDLGRVCEYGSIEVPSLFAVEEHPGLTHLVSTVRGRLRAEVGLGDLVRATFPPASVTGAPKPRVMQAIEDLEPVPRGVYCGAFGWIDGDNARVSLAVAIRTFTVFGAGAGAGAAAGSTHLGIGGGIVADSCAASEWAETELKGARLLQAARPGGRGSLARVEAR